MSFSALLQSQFRVIGLAIVLSPFFLQGLINWQGSFAMEAPKKAMFIAWEKSFFFGFGGLSVVYCEQES